MTPAFTSTYGSLPDALFSRQSATPVASPAWIAVNTDLAGSLGLPADWLGSDPALAVLGGNAEVPTALAQAYGGHQFGSWNPGLGDGRALLLGEIVSPTGHRFDLQLKGSGRTPYSRGGDGRAALGPVLREYIMSEAMAALGVPTTRALAAVQTGESIYRDAPTPGYTPGAILTRVASSHIRVGTFQLRAYHRDISGLRALFDHTAARHFPTAQGPADLLSEMMTRQADLIARWTALGFVHGVMNTDNMLVCGDTIDYGPCAFMDSYHPQSVFSSIDRQGRYAFANQPQIALWNIAQFASSLVPLMPDADRAIKEFTGTINTFGDLYQSAKDRLMTAKLGLPCTPAAVALVDRLLRIMMDIGADYTLTFAALDRPLNHPDHLDWLRDWHALRPDHDQIGRTNPQVIPRLHQIQTVIDAATEGDFAPFRALLAATTAPMTANADFQNPPLPHQQVAATFCGT